MPNARLADVVLLHVQEHLVIAALECTNTRNTLIAALLHLIHHLVVMHVQCSADLVTRGGVASSA